MPSPSHLRPAPPLPHRNPALSFFILLLHSTLNTPGRPSFPPWKDATTSSPPPTTSFSLSPTSRGQAALSLPQCLAQCKSIYLPRPRPTDVAALPCPSTTTTTASSQLLDSRHVAGNEAPRSRILIGIPGQFWTAVEHHRCSGIDMLALVQLLNPPSAPAWRVSTWAELGTLAPS